MKGNKKKFTLRLEGSILKSLSVFEIQDLIDKSDFSPVNYIYDREEMKWIRPMDRTDLFTWTSLDPAHVFTKPSFHPPPELNPKDDLEVENKDLQHTLMNKLTVIEALKFSRSKLEEDIHRIVEVKNEIEKNLLRERVRNDEIEIELKKTRETLIEVNSRNIEYQEEASQMSLVQNELMQLKKDFSAEKEIFQEEIKSREDRAVQKNTLKISNELDQLLDANAKLKTEVSLYKKKAESAELKAQELKQSMQKLREGISELKNLREKDLVMLKRLRTKRKEKSETSSEKLKQLTGSLFEVDNTPQWYIEIDKEIRGPFKFEEIKNFIMEKKVLPSTPVKKKNNFFWSNYEKTYELNAKVIQHTEIIDGIETNHYFIERSEYRAPFHGEASLIIEDETLTGFCTSLSLRGAFIGLKEVSDELVSKKGEKAILKINAGLLSEDLEVPVTLRNFNQEEVCGIGLQIEASSEAQQKIILCYINSYLEQSKKSA